MSEPARLLFCSQVGATLAMVGVIWIIQLVHYPLFAAVGPESFPAYAAAHGQRIAWVVIPLMLVEAGGAATLALAPPDGLADALPAVERWLGLALVLAIWGSTAFLQVPEHGRLASGFDAAAHRFLVGSNWLRTIAWTARGGVVLGWVARAVG